MRDAKENRGKSMAARNSWEREVHAFLSIRKLLAPWEFARPFFFLAVFFRATRDGQSERWTTRKPGRPTTTWRGTVMDEINEVKLPWDERVKAGMRCYMLKKKQR